VPNLSKTLLVVLELVAIGRGSPFSASVGFLSLSVCQSGFPLPLSRPSTMTRPFCRPDVVLAPVCFTVTSVHKKAVSIQRSIWVICNRH